jgi:hypothetical protein
MRTNVVRAVALALAITFLTAGCTASQLARFLEEEAEHRHVLSDRQLLRLRQCESSDNYQAKSPNGLYFGAYQFSKPTWNDVASRHYPWLVGAKPHKASKAEQDAMARALWHERGRAPWPYCGRRVGAR